MAMFTKTNVYNDPSELLKDEDMKMFIESNYEHLNIVLGYSGFLAGFQYLGMDFKEASDKYLIGIVSFGTRICFFYSV